MSTPARRPSKAVYRRRRLAVLLALLLVAGVVAAIAIWQPWNAWSGGGAAPAPSRSVSAGETPAASASPSSSPEASASADPDDGTETEASPSATPDADSTTAVLPCTAGDVTVEASTDKESYGVGELPQLSIRLTNDTALACLMNVGTAAQTFEISSGSDVWWRSTDCQTESSDHVVRLEPGQSVASATPLVWDRTRSEPETCGKTRPKALPGWYHLTVSIGGLEPMSSRQFRLR